MSPTIQARWADVQRMPTPRRYDAEESLINEMRQSLLASHPDWSAQIDALDGQALEMLCKKGIPSGWAYCHGFTVKWFPTRGVAKHSWYQDRAYARNHPQPGIAALGPKPTPCNLLKALLWGQGRVQTPPRL